MTAAQTTRQATAAAALRDRMTALDLAARRRALWSCDVFEAWTGGPHATAEQREAYRQRTSTFPRTV